MITLSPVVHTKIYIKRFNQTYRKDILVDSYIFHNLNEVKQMAEDWIEQYNRARPHESLNNITRINIEIWHELFYEITVL